MTKIVNRVRKLLALAQSPNIHEAAVAAAQAQRLIADHRIEQAMLEDVDDNGHGVRHHDDPLDHGSRVAQWRLELALVVAEANGCRVVVLKDGRYSTIEIVGHDEDVAVVRALYVWLTGEIQRLARASKLKGRDKLDTFRLGAISTIEARLEEANEAARKIGLKQAKVNNTTALVRVGLKSLARRGEEAERIVDEICEGREESLGEFGGWDAVAFVEGAVVGGTIDLSGHRNKLHCS